MAVGYFQGLLNTPVCPPVSVALKSTCCEVLEAASKKDARTMPLFRCRRPVSPPYTLHPQGLRQSLSQSQARLSIS